MKNSNKKGFTLVELLVVIAILAILATVAVVGYTSFTEKANISNDTVIAKELTTIIQATDINDPVEDFNDVIKALHDNGFLLANLNTKTAGCFFVWESKNNQILLVDADDNFNVLYPETYEPAGDTWYLACSDKDLLEGLTLPAGVQVQRTVSSVESLKEFIAEGKEYTVYIDESIAMNSQEQVAVSSGVITLKLADSSMYGNNNDGYAVDNIPFLVNGGTLNIEGGVISATGSWLDADGDPVDSAVLATSGVLNLSNTTVDGTGKEIVIAYDGANGTISNSIINANKSAINVGGGSTVVVENCIVNAEEEALWASGSGGYETKLVVNSGTFNANTETVRIYGTSIAEKYATIEINGGTFTSETDKLFRLYSPTGAKIIINGGTFVTTTGTYTFDELKAMKEDDAKTILEGMTNGSGVSIVKNEDGSFTLSK